MTNKSPFAARINMPDEEVPVRAYVHRLGLESVYKDVNGANRYLVSQLESGLGDEFIGYDYVIPIIGSDDKSGGNKLIDVFAFHESEDPGNPVVTIFNWYSGGAKSNSGNIATFGDYFMLIGKEEELRRMRSSLRDYLINPPNLGDFEPPISL